MSRHQFISSLAAAGVHPKICQALARHSTITLTMDLYSHVGLFDQTSAIDKLAPLPTTGRESHRLAATGTDGSPGEAACTPACTKLAPTADADCEGLIMNADVASTTAAHLSLENEDGCADLIPLESDCHQQGESYSGRYKIRPQLLHGTNCPRIKSL